MIAVRVRISLPCFDAVRFLSVNGIPPVAGRSRRPINGLETVDMLANNNKGEKTKRAWRFPNFPRKILPEKRGNKERRAHERTINFNPRAARLTTNQNIASFWAGTLLSFIFLGNFKKHRSAMRIYGMWTIVRDRKEDLYLQCSTSSLVLQHTNLFLLARLDVFHFL